MASRLGVVQPISKQQASELVRRYHYLGAKPFRATACYGLVIEDIVVGACVFHGLSAPQTAMGAFGMKWRLGMQDSLYELGRLVLIPELNGKNYGSFFVSHAIKAFRQEYNVYAIISYADADLHTGAIYQACNFGYYGLTAPKQDYYIDGKIKERGPTTLQGGEWRPRPRKHRYALTFDPRYRIQWPAQPYPKQRPQCP